MADNNRGRDIGKLRVYAPQERDPATMSEAEAAAERKRMLDLRAVLRKLEPDIRRHSALFDSGVVKTQKDHDKLRDLVLRAIGLGGEDKLPVSLLDEVGLRSEPNPTVHVENDGIAPF